MSEGIINWPLLEAECATDIVANRSAKDLHKSS
jgi:hypothetical protein